MRGVPIVVGLKHHPSCGLLVAGNAYQLSQLIRTLLDPENMALGANVSTIIKNNQIKQKGVL